MANNAKEVKVAVTGAFYIGPVSAVVPAGANSAVPSTFKDTGFTHADGWTVSNSTSTNKVLAWQNSAEVRTLISESSVSLAGKLLQWNGDNLELFMGRKKNTKTNAYHFDASNTGGIKSAILDVIDLPNKKKLRYYFPQIEITERGDIAFVSTDVTAFDLTMTVYKVELEGEAANYLLWEDDYTPPTIP